MKIIPQIFYQTPTLHVTRQLLGAIIETTIDGQKTSGIIVETEAYLSENDPACHAGRGMTKRNAVMFNEGGAAYIYLIYGLHYCFNVVTETKGIGCAVLVRAIEPLQGIEIMRQRRKTSGLANLTNGPGKVCQALGINLRHNGAALYGRSPVTIYQGNKLDSAKIECDSRIGISQGKELPYRYFIKIEN